MIESDADKLSKQDAAELDNLEREAKEFDKDAEIDRILKAFRLNAYEVLDLLPGIPDSDIKAHYRKKSLLIHPDKTKNPSAPEAFDRLAKAHNILLEEKEREKLDEAIADARMLVIRDQKWTTSSEELKSERFLRQLWPEKIKTVLVDNEMRRRKQMKAQMQEEGRAQRKEDEEAAERKRKREHEKSWEETRETRIGNWRDFQKGGKVKEGPGGGVKKKKMKVLG